MLLAVARSNTRDKAAGAMVVVVVVKVEVAARKP
jgi:hypothetical protein